MIVFFLFLFVFLFGLSVGSFLNVVILRYHKANPDESGFAFRFLAPLETRAKGAAAPMSHRGLSLTGLGGRSHCPHCQKTLGFWELIPVVSFLVQAGRCRSCRKLISWQYPLVELATGIVFTLIIWQYINGAI